MIKFEMVGSGLRDLPILRKRFRDAQGRFQTIMANDAWLAAQDLMQEAAERTPVATGKLAEGYRIEGGRLAHKGGRMTLTIVNDVRHMVFVVEGTEPPSTLPPLGPFVEWGRAVGVDPFVARWSIVDDGTEPYGSKYDESMGETDPLRAAWAAIGPDIQAKITAAARKAVRGI